MLKGFRHPDKPIETGPDMVRSLPEHDWIAQAKYDGWRTVIYIDSPDSVRCFSRTGRPMEIVTSKFDKSLIDLIKQIKVPNNTILDAEFVGPRGHLSPALYIFDVLAWDDNWLTQEHYIERWKRCQSLKLPDGNIHLAETEISNFIDFFERLRQAWIERGITLHEGIVVKYKRGLMKLGRNESQVSSTQLKLKYRDIQDARY